VSTFFQVVHKDIAANPIARAVARQRARLEMRDFTIGWYVPVEFVDPADVDAAAKALAVAIVLLERAGKADSPECRVMAGSMSTLAAISERKYRWRYTDAPAIDIGLQHALSTLLAADAKAQRDAWAVVHRMEAV
jgi:hypothetical protein